MGLIRKPAERKRKSVFDGKPKTKNQLFRSLVILEKKARDPP